MEKTKDITLYFVHPLPSKSQWEITTAAPKRDWMESYAPVIYRCLPLLVANQNGWFVKSPCDITAIWNGQPGTDSMVFTLGENYNNQHKWVSCYFGGGIITFVFDFFIKTTEKTNLLVRGAPNFYVDGAHPLEGLVETDWLNFSFTMNWKVTVPNRHIHFKKGDPICFLQPVPHNYSEEFNFNFKRLEDEPELKQKFDAYSASRAKFNKELHEKNASGIKIPANESWQRHYFEGIDVMDNKKVSDDVHSTKLKIARPE